MKTITDIERAERLTQLCREDEAAQTLLGHLNRRHGPDWPEHVWSSFGAPVQDDRKHVWFRGYDLGPYDRWAGAGWGNYRDGASKGRGKYSRDLWERLERCQRLAYRRGASSDSEENVAARALAGGPPATQKQVSYVMRLVSRVDAAEWPTTLGASMFHEIPSRPEVAALSKSQCSRLIDLLVNGP